MYTCGYVIDTHQFISDPTIIYIYPVTMVSVGYHCGVSVIILYIPQFELAVKHLGISISLMLTISQEQSL